MKTYRNLKNQKLTGDIIIGFFDCFHYGHMKLLKNKKASIITFKNTPSKNHDIFLFKQKISFLKNAGFEKIYVFNISKHNMTAQMFYDKYLINANKIIVGEDCKIGNDLQLVKSLAKQKQLKLIRQDKQFSSTKVKKFLKTGKVELANKLLYEKYNIVQQVKSGNKKGRIIGFRTANFYFKKNLPILEKGIYISQTTYRQQLYNSVTFWGIPKTIKNKNIPVMETHIIDFNHNIYFKKIKVTIFKKIDDIQKYGSISHLQEAIQKYISITHLYFHNLEHGKIE